MKVSRVFWKAPKSPKSFWHWHVQLFCAKGKTLTHSWFLCLWIHQLTASLRHNKLGERCLTKIKNKKAYEKTKHLSEVVTLHKIHVVKDNRSFPQTSVEYLKSIPIVYRYDSLVPEKHFCPLIDPLFWMFYPHPQ